jgi:hypothetical protein
MMMKTLPPARPQAAKFPTAVSMELTKRITLFVVVLFITSMMLKKLPAAEPPKQA